MGVADSDRVGDALGVLLPDTVPLPVPDTELVGDTLGVSDGLAPGDSAAVGVDAALAVPL